MVIGIAHLQPLVALIAGHSDYAATAQFYRCHLPDRDRLLSGWDLSAETKSGLASSTFAVLLKADPPESAVLNYG
jgi:hypothetical protein